MKDKTIKYRDYNKKYYQDNRESISIKRKKRLDKNRKEHNQQSLEYYYNYKDEISIKRKEYYKGMPVMQKNDLLQKSKIASKRRYDLYKSKFLEMYGDVCECCGEDTVEFLSIEHKLGQKGKKKDTSHKAYRLACLEYQPDIYGILCHNCNQATRHGSACPHKNKEKI